MESQPLSRFTDLFHQTFNVTERNPKVFRYTTEHLKVIYTQQYLSGLDHAIIELEKLYGKSGNDIPQRYSIEQFASVFKE